MVSRGEGGGVILGEGKKRVILGLYEIIYVKLLKVVKHYRIRNFSFSKKKKSIKKSDFKRLKEKGEGLVWDVTMLSGINMFNLWCL